MKKIIIFFLIFLTLCCKRNKTELIVVAKDSDELYDIYFNDQEDRQIDDIDWKYVNKRDSLRRIRVHQLLDSNKVVTPKDFENAAMVFQHGKDSTDYGLAVKLMKKSIDLDSIKYKWLFAAATDRYLLSIGKPQIYGTQYQKNGDEAFKLNEIDTTKISDEERIKFGVETLLEQKEKMKRLNEKFNQKTKKQN